MNGTATSLTGFTDSEGFTILDIDRQGDGRPDALEAHQEINNFDETTIFSQELRYASDWDTDIQFTLGGLYWTEDREQESANYIAVCNANPPVSPCSGGGWQILGVGISPDYGDGGLEGAENDHWSLYALLEWEINSQWKFSVENRFVWEDADVLRTLITPCFEFAGLTTGGRVDADSIEPGPNGELADIACTPLTDPGVQDDATTDSSFQTPKFILEWLPTDNAMIYASIAKGQKPGGISLLPTGAPNPIVTTEDLIFASEKMWAYELGAKTDWSGNYGGLVLNGAVFYQDYTDKQTNDQKVVDDPDLGQALVPSVTNASSAEVWGLELESNWLTPVEGLTVNLAYTWLDTEYNDFLSDTRSAQRVAALGQCDVIPVVPDPDPAVGADYSCGIDLTGNQLEKTPEHSFIGNFQFLRPLGSTGLEWYIGGDAVYQSERWLVADNLVEFDSFWKFDLRLGLEGENWDALLFVNNVTDDDTIVTGGSGPDFGQQAAELGIASFGLQEWFATFPQPRTFGVRANYRFGANR